MPTSSPLQGSGVFYSLTALLIFVGRGTAIANPYVLETTYSGASFFDGFDFFTDPDPTHGFVNYVDRATAQLYDFISSGNDVPAYMGVDYSTHIYPNMTQGRASVRIESKKTFTHGLFISDIEHMPGSICGTWPAHWTLGHNWPTNGEIDIIEGVNSGIAQQNRNLMSLHTSPGCTIAGANETGSLQSNNCDTTVDYNSGCGVLSDTITSYGNDFNEENGGVYATEWTSDYIRIWFFTSGTVPPDISNGTPNPAQWGPPKANFQGSCSIDEKFANHKIIFDTTFCGDYAGSVWNSDTTCSTLALTCNDYVAQHPEAFLNAFWSVHSVKVYQQASPPLTSAPSFSSTVPQSSISAPGMGYSNSSRISASSFPAATVASNVGAFKYLGCASSSSSFTTFDQVGDSLDMTLEKCTSECGAASYEYAGVFATHCYCAKLLSGDVTVTPGQGSCTKPCPGNIREFCGGELLGKRKIGPRQIETGVLLSLYSNTALTISSVVPQNAVPGYGMGGGASSVISTVISTTYIDACDICENGFRTIATAATIEHCGCMDVTVTPTIPMTTITKSCSACGEGGSPAIVTVTVPCALDTHVAPVMAVIPVTGALNVSGVRNGSTHTTTSSPTKFTDGATALKVNVGAAIAGMMVLGML